VLAPALRDEYDLTLTQVGVLLAAEWVGLTISMIPWGFAVDRWGERWTLTVGLTACAGCLAGAAYAPSFAALLVLLGAAGITGGSVQSGSGRAVMRWFDASQRGLALGVRQTAVPVGGLVAALVLPALPSPREGFLFLAAIVAFGAVAGALVLRAGPEHVLEPGDVEWSLRDRRLWIVCAASSLYLVAQIALMGFLVLFLHDERGYSDGAAAGVFAIGQALAAVLRIAIGRWSDVMRARVRPLRLVGGAVAAALALVAVLETSGDWILVPTLVVATGLAMGWNGLSFTIAAEIGGRRSGAAIGFQQTALSAVGVVAPVVFAATVSWASWRTAFALSAAFPLVGAWLLRSLDER
jgi:sugar phosphate permease